MELFQVDISGFRKFKEKTSLKTRGKVLAILGANEAGKSSILRALTRLNDSEPFESSELSRGPNSNNITIKARYSLSEEDRDVAGAPTARWFVVTKDRNGKLSSLIEPRLGDRDFSHRPRLNKDIYKIKSKARAVSLLAEIDEELLAETEQFCGYNSDRTNDLSDSEKLTLSNISARWKSALNKDSPAYLHLFSERLAEAETVESAESTRLIADRKLLDRVPKFLFFGSEDRNLKSSYEFSEIATVKPDALKNLAKVANLDLDMLISTVNTNGKDPEIDTMIEQANAALKMNFQAVWKQSPISVVLAHRDQSILIQVYNNVGQRTEFAQRSDGLRQFVALRCFTAAREDNNFILLIDEAEQHLHYDAQADLVQMFASQTVAAKVIYTTHSVGCLPEDLGNGVRLVEPTAKLSDWSKIENKFWTRKNDSEAAFSPILMGMGASTMAFFPTRSAVLVEGPSDTILLPTMFREALSLPNLGIQFVHGLSEDGRMQLPLLNSTGREVCYLLDDDDGGRKLRADLEERKMKKERIFQLQCLGGDCELEDFVDPSLLAEAASELGVAHLNVAKLVDIETMPKVGKWDHINVACRTAEVEVLSKVDVAYAILDILDADPSRNILDKRLKNSFKAIAEKVRFALKESKGLVLAG